MTDTPTPCSSSTLLLRALARRVNRSLQLRGATGTLLLAPKAVFDVVRRAVAQRVFPRRRRTRAAGRDFDESLGIETDSEIGLESLEITGENVVRGTRYQPTPPNVFSRLLAWLDIDHAEYDLIDIGSGKGRVLFLASLYPFKRIIGVEFSAELTAIARRNVESFRHPERRCMEILPLCVDATTYDLPATPTVLYMFNPFGAPVMEALVRNIEASLRAHPRELFVVYYNAIHRELFDRATSFVEIASDMVIHGDSEPWVIYRSATSNGRA